MINVSMIFFYVSELLKDESTLDSIRLRARPCIAEIPQGNAVLQSVGYSRLFSSDRQTIGTLASS